MPIARSSRRKLRQFPLAEPILGPLPLFEGEDGHAYEEVLKHLRATIPRLNFLVEMLIRDIVYHPWPIDRYRRREVEFSRIAEKRIQKSPKIGKTKPKKPMISKDPLGMRANQELPATAARLPTAPGRPGPFRRHSRVFALVSGATGTLPLLTKAAPSQDCKRST